MTADHGLFAWPPSPTDITENEKEVTATIVQLSATISFGSLWIVCVAHPKCGLFC